MVYRKSSTLFIFMLLFFGMVNSVFSQAIPGQYIVVFKDSVGNPGAAASAMGRAHGFQPGRVYSHAIKGFAAAISPAALAAIQNNPNVAYVEQDGIAHAVAQTLPTGINRIDVDKNVIAKIDGIDERVDVDIAVLDTGVDADHPDLNVVGVVNFTSDGPDDRHGHGTHVAGTAAAVDNGLGVVGVAPGARIHGVKVLGDTGSGTWSWVIGGIDWVTQNAGTIEVANMSLSGTGWLNSLRTAIQNGVNAGVVFVVAAGNSSRDVYGADGVMGTFDDQTPAAFPEVAAISALSDSNGQPGGDVLASFSNFSQSVAPGNPVISPGAAIDLAGPGVSIYSTYRDGGYATLSGTSMASPHVAGLAALLAGFEG
ncbi:MAG: S8 family peptidase [Gammaproteobacteria bacterium]|nr:S8 family peptidase [Gammaproteobacteria bacterium]